MKKSKQLYDQGFISSAQFDAVQAEYYSVSASYEYAEKERTIVQAEIFLLEAESFVLPEKILLKKIAIKRKVAEITAKQVELDNQYESVMKAPEAGIVTSVQPSNGSKVDANTPLLSIIPIDSPLEIELLLPSRSAGFVQLGDSVNIRFDAFPYQRFGLITGKVSNVDKALILPSDKVLPIKIGESMYRVRATLAQQSVKAYGKTYLLKVGMIAEADIILEKRSLLDWLLDPIYAVKGKL